MVTVDDKDQDGKNSPDQPKDVLNQLSRLSTDKMITFPGIVLDELVFTIRYCVTARNIGVYSETSDKPEALHDELIQKRYENEPSLLESDLGIGPVIIERLERLSREKPEAPITSKFAFESLPYVRTFVAGIKRYSNSLQGL